MPRSHIVILTLFTAVALAQRPVVGQQATVLVNSAATVAAPLHANDVVARMMSFDRNHDGLIEAGELPDRMQNLFVRGDTGRDGALDGAEIHALATTPTVALATGGGRRGGGGGGYTFGDQVGLSSRSHIDGALDDLMLSSPVKEKAQAIVKTFVDDLEATAAADLLKEMESLLSADQLTAFKTALERQNVRRVVAFPPQLKEFTGNVQVFFGLDLALRVRQFSLPAAQNREALVAIERFKARLRPGDAERSTLLAQMKGVLTDEERDNFRAALERRPLVKAGFPGGVSGVVRGEAIFVNPSSGPVRNLLLDRGTADAAVVVR